MNGYILKSNFKDDISKFLGLKHLLGYKYELGQKLIEQFDDFCFSIYPDENILTEKIALDWATPREKESASSIVNRIIVVREFAKFLNTLYKNAFVIPGQYIPKNPKYDAYIYTNMELQKIFDVIDNQKFRCYHKNSYIVFPLLFRIFYCCGLRISEVLSLKVKHIDLVNGIIAVYESKNNDNRFVVLSDELKDKCTKYYSQMHKDSNDDDYFFYTKDRNKPIVETTLRKSFRQILKISDIEKSKQNNPRIHDFRHTYAVHCLKKFVNEDKNLYAYLPILKTYMGHSKFKSTEYYLKFTNDMYPDILEKTNLYINEAIPKLEVLYEKYKRDNLKGIYRHNERRNKNYSNKNIDSSKLYLNYSIKAPKFSYEKEFERLRKEYNLKGQIKTVSNIACEYIITSDKNFFESIGEDETKRYFETAYNFVSEYKELGEEYILSAKVHMDEETPHMHLVFIPVVHTTDKKGNAIDKIACSEFWKAKDSYRQLQDAFYEYMTAHNFELERGMPSNRKHLSVTELKEITNYDKTKRTLEDIKFELPKVLDITEINKLTLKRDEKIQKEIIEPKDKMIEDLHHDKKILLTKLQMQTVLIDRAEKFEKERKKLYNEN